MRWRIREARVAVEAPPGAQTAEDLAGTPLEPLLQLHGIVTRVEDEKRGGNSFFEPTQQSLHLLCGDHVGVLGGSEAFCVHGSSPTLAGECAMNWEAHPATMG